MKWNKNIIRFGESLAPDIVWSHLAPTYYVAIKEIIHMQF